ncbi:hypothetical protein BBJ28_00000302 [Nothophytophthora sp. Chile5]|nr:hypothetical protein BBJ28_00000302 [Nothophytophthora sp. Chile5]
MQPQPLPTCDEYDPLDAHLDELEEPGANFLQDTPLSNGYTSEESDYSVVTPSDEQNYRDMSFLQAAPTSELLDVVADVNPADLGALPHPPQKFAGKVIKGKTSKYRGVTQTSKTSWGAKYSAKRITNTCKTPDEAARAYDAYLQANYPQKYAKFANFCDKCGHFVNPLGLPQFPSECVCSPASRGASGVKQEPPLFSRQQITTPTAATPSLVPPTAPSPAAGPAASADKLALMGSSSHSLDLDPANEEEDVGSSLRASNLSIGSLKFSFSEDTEQFFDESFNVMAKMATAGDDQPAGTDQKRDSLPMAVISSAVDSFTQEDNLDQIIQDINRSSSSHSLIKGGSSLGLHRVGGDSVDSFAATGSSSGSGKRSELETLQAMDAPMLEPTTTNSLDFDVDELDELTKYFLSENDAAAVVQRELQLSHPELLQPQAADVASPPRPFQKIHSLDFDADDAMTGSSRGGLDDVKIEGGDLQSIHSFMQPAGLLVPTGSPLPAVIELQTPFLDKYWRNDRKNIQCFPYCPEHGDYYRVRIENLQHRCKGVCRAAVKARISIPTPMAQQAGMLVLARCNSTFSRNEALTAQRSLSLTEMKALQSVSAVGVLDRFGPLESGAVGVQFDVTFHPDVWKFEFDLPKKRRHVHSSVGSPATSASHMAEPDAEHLAAEFLYFFEIDVFYSPDKAVFERLGHAESMNFQIGNTRTLLRQRNKMVEEFNSSGGPLAHSGHNDNDKLVDADELPDKKKVKVYLGQRELLSGTSLSEDGGSISAHALAGHNKLSLGYITGEGISSSSKRNLLEDRSTPMDVDGYFRSDSKDSLFDHEASSSELPEVKSDVWKDVDSDSDDLQQAATADYRPYVSPKQKGNHAKSVPTLEPPSTVATKPRSTSRPTVPASSAPKEAYSLPKLLGYSAVCVPLSVLFIPVGIILLLGFLLLPPAASGIVGALDALSDMELSRANSSRVAGDSRLVLHRLVEDKMDAGAKPKGGLFRYHGKGEVWSRFLYFSGAKFVVSMAAFMPTFILALLAGLLYPIRPASAALARAACSCALWSREYTRETTGKPLAPSAAQYEEVGGLV